MPAYNFKSQFAEKVRAGQKRTTLRPRRQNPTLAGQLFKAYTGMRTSQCRLLRDSKVLSVLPASIDPFAKTVTIDGYQMDEREALKLAQGDGFETIDDFFGFFVDTYSPDGPMKMELITWE